MKKTRPHKKSKSIFRNPVIVVGIITVAGSVLIAVIQTLPQLVRPAPKETESPAVTASLPATPSRTEAQPTLEATKTPTATFVITPSETPSLSLPSTECLSTWFRVDTARLPTPTSTAEGTLGGFDPCPPITDMGISSVSNELVYSKEGFRAIQGLFGISHRIDDGYVMNMKVISNRLFNAEFWVALSTNPNPADADNPPEMISIVLVPATQDSPSLTGTIAIYRNSKKLVDKKWAEILNISGTSRAPFVYQVRIQIAVGRIVITVNNREIANEIGIFPTYLFLGYNKKSGAGSAIVDVSIKDFEVIPVR